MVYIHNTAKSCNKIQSSQNMGENVSRIGFKREAGETAWNTGAPVNAGDLAVLGWDHRYIATAGTGSIVGLWRSTAKLLAAITLYSNTGGKIG